MVYIVVLLPITPRGPLTMRETVWKKAIKPLNSNFVFLCAHQYFSRKKNAYRLNRVVFQWNPSAGIRDPILEKGCGDETSRGRSGVPVKCFQTQLYIQYNKNTTPTTTVQNSIVSCIHKCIFFVFGNTTAAE